MSKNVLIIDNDEMNRGLLRLVLEYDGYHCMEAANGAMGLMTLESQHVDVIIVDQGTPGRNGMEFFNQLRENSQKANTPVIIATGVLNREFREAAFSLGAYAIIEKPYDFGALRLMVAQASLSPSSHMPVLLPQ